MWVCALVVGAEVAVGGGGGGGGNREDWRGAVDVIGDAPIEFVVHVGAGPGEGWTLDIPGQGLREEPLSDYERAGEVMRFTVRFAGKPEKAWAKFEMRVSEDGKSAAGTMGQWGQSFPAVMRLIPGGPGAVGEVGGEEVERAFWTRGVSFTNAGDGVRIAGRLTIPGEKPRGRVVGDRRQPAALIVGDDAGLMEALAEELARAGLASLRLDERGVGGSTGEKGKASEEDRAADVRGALGLLRVQPDVDDERMAVVGIGRGAASAAVVGEEGKGVAGVALIGTRGAPLDETMVAKGGRKARLIVRAGAEGEAGLAAEAPARVAEWLADRFGVSEKRE